MSYCTKCGNALKQGDMFCEKCGEPIVAINTNQFGNSNQQANTQPNAQANGWQMNNPNMGNGIPVILRYERNPMMILLLADLNVTIDGRMKYRVPPNGQIQISLPPGDHFYEAFVPYMTDYGKTRRTVRIAGNSTTITYKAPMAVFLEGNLRVVNN